MTTAASELVKQLRRRDGYYHLPGDRKYPAVTEILKATGFSTRPLMWWAAKTAAGLVLSNPDEYDSAEKAASGIYQVRDKAADRGSMVHSLAEAIDRGGNILPDLLPEAVRPYGLAYKAWYDLTQPEVLFAEATVWNDAYQYAGTLDLLCRIGETVWIVDRKTSKAVYDDHILQVSAYANAEFILPHGSEEPAPMPQVNAAGILLLQSDGTPDFKVVQTDFAAFLHARGLWAWAEARST